MNVRNWRLISVNPKSPFFFLFKFSRGFCVTYIVLFKWSVHSLAIFFCADKIPAGLQPLADKITKLLMKFPASRVAQFAFSDIYLSEYGQVLKPKEWGFGNIDALMRALGNILEVRIEFFKLVCSLFCANGSTSSRYHIDVMHAESRLTLDCHFCCFVIQANSLTSIN